MGFMALITAMVLFARYQDYLLSMSVRTVHVVLSTVGFKGGEKPCPTARETTALLELFAFLFASFIVAWTTLVALSTL